MNKLDGAITGKLPYKMFEITILALWLASINASAVQEYDQFPALDTIFGRGWQLALANLFLAVLVVVLLKQSGLYNELVAAWQKNLWLLAFLVLSLASLMWSVYLPATIYEAILLLCSTFIASYFSVRYRLPGMITILTWFAAVCTVASLMIVFLTPFGIMHGTGHADSWRGLFWHRNHAGSLMAFFNMIFLARMLMDKNLMSMGRIICGIFYILTAMHVFGSRSATGKIIYLILNFSTVISFFWIKWRTKIKTLHYYSLALALVAGLLIFVTNMPFFFGIFGRSATMTGRTMMWPDLFLNFFLAKPILGHGFGAIWMRESFRILMQGRWGWSYQPYFSDNGYLDLLLNLGVAGLTLFLIVFILACVRTVRRVSATGSWVYIFSLLTIAYIFLANLSYSFLFEVDYFIWCLLVLMGFVVSMPEKTQA